MDEFLEIFYLFVYSCKYAIQEHDISDSSHSVFVTISILLCSIILNTVSSLLIYKRVLR